MLLLRLQDFLGIINGLLAENSRSDLNLQITRRLTRPNGSKTEIRHAQLQLGLFSGKNRYGKRLFDAKCRVRFFAGQNAYFSDPPSRVQNRRFP